MIEFAKNIISLIDIGEPIILGWPNRNLRNYTILDNWVFENFIIADEQCVRALQIFETCVSVNDKLCGKLVSSLAFSSNLMKDSKLFQFHFLFQILTY